MEAVALAVHPHQQAFVPTVESSLAKAYIRPNGFSYDPYGIYRKRVVGQQIIGFFSLIHLPEDPTFCYLGGFFIAHQFQGQGYGKAALVQFMAFVADTLCACRQVFLSVHPQNNVAMALYQTHGFEKTGQWLDDEEELCFWLTTSE